MQKLLVYPFNKDLSPLVRYRSMLKGYELATAIPEKGFAWEGKEAGEIDGGTPTGFLLSKEAFLTELEQCDAVLLNKDGIGMWKEYDRDREVVQTAAKELINTEGKPMPESELDIQPELKLKEIPVPVITVMGLGENCQKFDIQLGLRDTFLKAGYRVSQFGTKGYSHLFGFEALPELPELSLWKKVYRYNELFWETYQREKPDIMIVGIPGGIMPVTPYASERFGETAMALSYAARPDITLLSYYYAIPTPEYFDMLRQYARYRLGAANVIFHASNTKLIVDKDQHKLSYLTLDSRFVLEETARQAPEMHQYIFNSLCQESSELAYLKVLEKLQQNICIM